MGARSMRISNISPPDIEVDLTTPIATYECLADGQIDSLITNPNLWKSGQTALFRHESNIFMKVTVVESLPFDPMSKAPPAYVVNFKVGDVKMTVTHRQLLKLQDAPLEIPSKSRQKTHLNDPAAD